MLSVPLRNIEIDRVRSQEGNHFRVTLRNVVLGIAFMEMMLSSWSAGLLFYSALNYEHVVKQLFQFPDCLTDSCVVAFLNSLSIFSGIECVLGAWLFEAVKHNKLRHIFSWLVILLTYEIVLVVFVLSLGFVGCSTDRTNRWTFFRVFFRFIEFLVIFIFMESETMSKMRRKARRIRDMLASRDRGDVSIANATSVANLLTCDNYEYLQKEDFEGNTTLQKEGEPIEGDP